MDNLKNFIDKMGIQCKITRIPFRTDLEWEGHAKHFAYTLSRVGNDNKIKGYYSQGEAIKGTPRVTDIVLAMLMDTQGIADTSFDMWCGDFGYDTDSRKALNTYQACMKEYGQIKSLFSSEEMDKLYHLSSEC